MNRSHNRHSAIISYASEVWKVASMTCGAGFHQRDTRSSPGSRDSSSHQMKDDEGLQRPLCVMLNNVMVQPTDFKHPDVAIQAHCIFLPLTDAYGNNADGCKKLVEVFHCLS